MIFPNKKFPGRYRVLIQNRRNSIVFDVTRIALNCVQNVSIWWLIWHFFLSIYLSLFLRSVEFLQIALYYSNLVIMWLFVVFMIYGFGFDVLFFYVEHVVCVCHSSLVVIFKYFDIFDGKNKHKFEFACYPSPILHFARFTICDQIHILFRAISSVLDSFSRARKNTKIRYDFGFVTPRHTKIQR